MAQASIRVRLGASGASLKVVARELRRMDSRQVNEAYRRRLARAAEPYAARVRASVMAIPTKPGGKHTGLRARIADCVEVSTGSDEKSGWASIWVNPFHMLPDYVTLPLYMQGVKESRTRNYSRWRHPVYGHREREWKQQDAHPYFYQAASPFGRAAGTAINAALDDITRKING